MKYQLSITCKASACSCYLNMRETHSNNTVKDNPVTLGETRCRRWMIIDIDTPSLNL